MVTCVDTGQDLAGYNIKLPLAGLTLELHTVLHSNYFYRFDTFVTFNPRQRQLVKRYFHYNNGFAISIMSLKLSRNSWVVARSFNTMGDEHVTNSKTAGLPLSNKTACFT